MRAASEKAVIRSEQFSAIYQELSGSLCLHPQSEVREDGFEQGIIGPLKGQGFSIEKCSSAPLPPGQPPADTPSPSASSRVSSPAGFSGTHVAASPPHTGRARLLVISAVTTA